ncbi:cell division ATP-binding protein FtsE [Agromyces protaetiae]|uniref:Cell division ATP-binding protein FtsE n=1 Tax=Agromyces protaetiae TaxID=2509455 RepID=A0A4P6FCV3_9MICO|nr:cell division ATP-binding protein FtsE [Agromyces protaetiae]QAY73665.1 cell division ATP-binding protein FtsE [Agromyces protaetiae]
MIRFDHVTKKYPGQGRPALDDVGVEILRGEFVFLVGASGSGKSSFLRLILKEARPTSGKIHVLGQDLGTISSRKVPYFRRNLGVVFQDFRLLPNKSVYENVAFTLRVIGKSRGFIHQAVPETLKLVGLEGKEKRMPHELSGGEQQRVAIARAIVNKPQILLADEPTGNLDPVTSAGIMTLLERISASGTTIVMATHEAGIVDQMRRRVIELSAGVIVRDERSAGYDGQTVRDVEYEPVTEGQDADVSADAAGAKPAKRGAAGTAGKAGAAKRAPSTKAAAGDKPAPTAAPASTSKGTAAGAAAAGAAGASARKKVDGTKPDASPEPATTTGAAPITAAAPKVTPEVMRDAAPLYIEPEATDAVTDEAAEITAAATGKIAIDPKALVPEASDADETSAPLTLAERLGLRAPGGPRDDDRDQEVGPTT